MNFQNVEPIVTCYGGSLAYGTNLPTSDVDIRGIFCADKISIITPFFPVREVTLEDQEDGKLYELTNFMKLYCDMNPNILELLWVDEKSILSTSEAYKHLRSYAQQLLSKKVAFTFTGYAMAQMKRIKGHNKWINRPQTVEYPVRIDFMKLQHSFSHMNHKDFNLRNYNEGYKLVPYGNNIFGLLKTSEQAGTCNRDGSIKKFEYESFSDEEKSAKPVAILKMCEDEYLAAKEVHSNYWTWKKNRNEKRSALEESFGYDTKHASHVVRLLRMGSEILETGKVNVFRPDAQELLDIRNGKLTYEELLEYAEFMDNKVSKELYKTSFLPKSCDLNLAAKALMETQEICWGA